MTRYEDLTGRRFGKLLVLGENHSTKRNRRYWNCRCDCGNTRIVPTAFLNNGRVEKCSSCCKKAQSENAIKVSKSKHGMVKTKLWRCWRSMRTRCSYPRTNGYNNYGGRGIKVCDEWDKSFEKFMEWAYSNGYEENLTLDRIDVNGDYCPENCRWLTIKQQANNKRTNFVITHNGVSHTLSEWSEITGINKNTLESRLKKYGWETERALSVKPKVGGNYD